MLIPTKYVVTKSKPTPKVHQTVAIILFQNKTPKICGTDINGINMIVAIGFAISLLSRPKKRISRKRIVNWWKCRRSGRPAGVPNFQRLHMAKTVSATGQKKIKRIANGLISEALFSSRMADHTRTWPKV